MIADEHVTSAIQYAANSGIGIAQKTLGDWYSKGWFVSKNLQKAKEFYDKAKMNNYNLDEMAPSLPQQQGNIPQRRHRR